MLKRTLIQITLMVCKVTYLTSLKIFTLKRRQRVIVTQKHEEKVQNHSLKKHIENSVKDTSQKTMVNPKKIRLNNKKCSKIKRVIKTAIILSG